jgi:hypothetical protein
MAPLVRLHEPQFSSRVHGSKFQWRAGTEFPTYLITLAMGQNHPPYANLILEVAILSLILCPRQNDTQKI